MSLGNDKECIGEGSCQNENNPDQVRTASASANAGNKQTPSKNMPNKSTPMKKK